MAYVGLNTGSAANAGDGSTLRAGANIVNANFKEIYTYFGDGSTLSFSGGNWVEVATGINTLSYVGIGTTNPTDPLTVLGGANINGVATATKFSGIGSFSDMTVAVGATFNGNVMVGAGITAYASSGIISATKYYGDGSTLLSVPSGLGTALSDDTTSALNRMYYVDATLGVGATITVDPPSSSMVAFTNYPNVEVLGDYDLIVADGDDFIPDILGIGTTGIGGVLAGSGGRVRADNYTSKAGAAPTFPSGVVVSGVATVGDISITGFNATGIVTAAGGVDATIVDASSNLYAVTGVVTTLTAVNSLTVTNDATVGGALTISGNLEVQGTQTIINTSTLDIEDKTVGIASTTNATDTTADGAGIEVYASSSTANNNKTLKWEKTSASWQFGQKFKPKGVVETCLTPTATGIQTFLNSAEVMVLQCDLNLASTFTYTLPTHGSGNGGNIGIVSFKNFPADQECIMTPTILFQQGGTHMGATGYGNTLAVNGIGATVTINPWNDGSEIVGINTRGWVGSGTTVTLSPSSGSVDVVSFLIHYAGSSPDNATSYKVYVTKNGGFTFPLHGQ